jgi:hypothetical protein
MGFNPPIIVVVIYAVFATLIYALAGAFLGAIWPLLRGKIWRLTIARLMLFIAVIGLSLRPLLAEPLTGLLLLATTLLVSPTVIAALVVADRNFGRLHDPRKTHA